MKVKPPKTYEEQVALIEKKGFAVTDREACIAFLREAKYYRLPAYCLSFREAGGTSIQGVPFQQIQRIYEFGSQMRILLLQAIERIELYVRAQLAYYLGHHYGALGYLNDAVFSSKHNSEKFHEVLKRPLKENEQTSVVIHRQGKYNGPFPMCVKSWLRCVSEPRNRCAHYAGIYYWTFPDTPKTPKNFLRKKQTGRKVFFQILVLKYLYPDKKEWTSKVFTNIEALVNMYLSAISLERIGFPDNWKTILSVSSNG